MKIVVDIALLAIIAMCTWSGYKRGLIGGVASILAIVIALFGGSLLSSAYAGEVIPALKPFVEGYIDSQTHRDEILDRLGYGSSLKSLDDILAEDPSLKHDYAYECMLSIGLYEERAEEMTARAVQLAEDEDMSMTDAIISVLCDTITHVAGLLIAFLLILILLIAAASVFNMSFRIPNMENLDEIGGAVLGFARGFLCCVLLCWLLSFLGLVIGKDTMQNTTLARFFLTFDFVTKGLL